MSCFCYLHIFPNDKIYVGSTQRSKPEIRWQNGSGYKSQPLVWNAICKYGWENIRHKVIVCETPEEMWEMERELIKKYDTTNPEHGYNLSTGGEHSTAGYHFSEEHKRKLSAAFKGKKRPPFTEKHRKRLSESKKGEKNPNYEKTCPEFIRQKISESMKGKNTGPISEEHRRKISESMKGKMIGENNPAKKPEVRRKLSESMKGKNTRPHPKLKWLTPSGEIKYMDIQNATKLHPDWKEVKDD